MNRTTRIISGDQAVIAAADLLRSGHVVGLPTETVYGLAADATNPEAVAKLFSVKGRPAHNPLITHVHTIAHARLISGDWPPAAVALAQAYWPGPLTIIVPSIGKVAPAVTASHATIAIRIPAHPIMQQIITAVGRPLAAPSANRSGHISPTTAQHVFTDLAGLIELIVDGGDCDVGLESTVVGFPNGRATIYRPGVITSEDIADTLLAAGIQSGPVPFAATDGGGGPLLSPGMLERHYAPLRPAYHFDRSQVPQLTGIAFGHRGNLGLITFGPLGIPAGHFSTVALATDLYQAARGLYAAMHSLDRPDIDAIFIEMPTDETALRHAATSGHPPIGMARVLADRIRRASLPLPLKL